jgi:hypothetical protein
MELRQVQKNYNGWKEQRRKKDFEAQGFNPGSGVASQQSSLTTIVAISKQESFCLGLFFLGGWGAIWGFAS